MSEKSFSDIQTKMWFDRWLPSAMYPYARLARWDRPVGVWLLFLPCLWGMFFVAADNASLFVLLKYTTLFLIGSVAMRGAGCTINDLWDQDIDRKVERTQNRPLASGQITKKQALAFLALQSLIGAIILFQFNGAAVFIGLLSIPLIILYPLMKRWTWWPQAFLGITFNWGVLLGAAATQGGLSVPVIWLYLGCVCWTIAYDTIYAFQDIEDDITIGIRSTARLFGEHAKRTIGVFYGAMFVCFLTAGYMAQAPYIYSGLIAFVMAIHVFYLIKVWQSTSQASSLAAFKRHITFGWGITAIMILKFVLTV